MGRLTPVFVLLVLLAALSRAGMAEARGHATPGPRLLTPGRGAAVAAPPQLRWTRVRGATYYNVQLFRGHRKLLSAWPSSASFQLRAHWRFAGHTRRLTQGRYRWYVWPGYGARAERRYGKLVGSRSFVLSPVTVQAPAPPPPASDPVPAGQEQQQEGDGGKHWGDHGGEDNGDSGVVPGGQEQQNGDRGDRGERGDHGGGDGHDGD